MRAARTRLHSLNHRKNGSGAGPASVVGFRLRGLPPGATVVFPVPPERVRSVAALKSRLEQGQLRVFTPFALRHSHRFGAPLGEDGIGWEL